MNKREALAALAAGKKIRCTDWRPGSCLCLDRNGKLLYAWFSASGQELVEPVDLNAYRNGPWEVVTDERDERDELAEALHAADELNKLCAPVGSIAFATVKRYLNRRARELGLKVSE